ncbi:hypothetical protein ACFQS7_15500 [Dankookia sp. GCM10030260]|uniref:hypothetical protein n=1 Tax=Dankookia sp. GCM10030260 TaxID=3273390 RepID=UPI00360A763B
MQRPQPCLEKWPNVRFWAGTQVPGVAADALRALARARRAFIIRDARFGAEAVAAERSIVSIAGRAISSMIHYSGNSDILRLQLTAARDGVDSTSPILGRTSL